MANGIFQRLRGAFRSPNSSRPPTRQLFIEADDSGEIEVLPASVAGWCAGQFGAIAAFSARHEAPGGEGWNDIYLRPSPPSRIADLVIPFAAAVAVLEDHLSRFDAVVTGSPVRPVPGAHASGSSPLVAIVLIPDAARAKVASIDVVLRRGGAEAAAALGALGRLPSPEPLIIVDWVLARYASLADLEDVQSFLRDTGG